MGFDLTFQHKRQSGPLFGYQPSRACRCLQPPGIFSVFGLLPQQLASLQTGCWQLHPVRRSLTMLAGSCPRVLPPLLRHLKVTLDPELAGHDGVVPDGFAARLSSLQHLTQLSLELGFSAKLCGSAVTQQPLSLELQFCVNSRSPLQLEWLTKQAFTHLSISVSVQTARSHVHKAVVHLLQQLQDAAIHISLSIPFSERLQRIWAKLVRVRSLNMDFLSQMGLAPRLQMLPQGRTMFFTVYGLQQISWAALWPDAHVTHFLLFGDRELHFWGCPAPVIGSAEPPSLLQVLCKDPSQVHGLSPPCLSPVYRQLSHSVSISKTHASAAESRMPSCLL